MQSDQVSYRTIGGPLMVLVQGRQHTVSVFLLAHFFDTPDDVVVRAFLCKATGHTRSTPGT
jgi:hypothetical protein